MTASVLPDLDAETVEELRPPCDCLDNFRECHRVAEWATLIRCNACRRAERNLLCGWHHAYFFVDHSPAFCRSCGADDPPYTPLEAVRL